ncbi:binding-protein-dependent transport systems inner membrane component [Beutenbergia cavernae DSM 12333]|uniref:Binding-protein-dependent transport systems inner membrane component n=1 Tax=Beutenbergia cavernae (strain ATCC BAA-8 / DSM 12333 / CCUG 43141 / JCM 11478 / NBRC 16432 / NCIMB 13614 / HKI 0122) TaxID=471853 RepID=C5BV19_BEUC1|nr:sugar ABC transporter permease [Beutenbergia cavernae]ACQ78393.1 binding-protein-dependent transport systems inner membrane component [Beutenbergia cavernae DSM 12333]
MGILAVREGGDVAAVTSPPSERQSRLARRGRMIGLAAVLPAFLVVVGFMIYPVLFALYISFNDSNGLRFDWVGLANYLDILADPQVHQIFITNLKFLISVPLVIFAALVVSILLFERIRGWRAFRVLFFLPNVLSAAVIGIMFKSVFGYNGPFMAALEALGGERIDPFVDGNLAIAVIVLALVWSGFGYQSLLLLSGLTAIDPAVFEAAALDGAGWWTRLWHITLPNIRRVLGFVFIINVLYTFSSLFGFVFVMTAGGPGFETTTLDYLVYLRAFSTSNLGSGAALAVLLFMFIGLLTLVQARFFKLSEDD